MVRLDLQGRQTSFPSSEYNLPPFSCNNFSCKVRPVRVTEALSIRPSPHAGTVNELTPAKPVVAVRRSACTHMLCEKAVRKRI